MSIDTKFPWSFSGFIIGIIALIVSVIIFYYSESKDKFDFKLVVEDEFNLIELKDELKDLKILYKDENILEHNKEIKIVLYTFTNEGKLITQDYYDRNKDFAIEFDSSKVLSTSIISSNSEYLKKDFLIGDKDSLRNSNVNFNKLIFESGKKITLKSYLIQNKGTKNTQINFLGKIAGIDEFNIIRKTEDIEKKKSLDNTSLKVIYWFFGVYFGLIVILLIITRVSSIIERKHFEKVWLKFIKINPTYGSQKGVLEKIKFSPRLNRIASRLLKGENVLDISEYIGKQKSFSPFELILGRKNWISFPDEVFNIENKEIKFKTELYSLFKDYFDFNDKEL